MGVEVYFRFNVAEDPSNSFLPDEDADPLDNDPLCTILGEVHFSGFTGCFQKQAYGVNFEDCLSRGPEGEGEEWGPPDPDKGCNHWYTPDWTRCLARAERLLAAYEATSDVHCREYDINCVPQFVALVRKCANHATPNACQVRMSF